MPIAKQASAIRAISYNVRGLNDENKLRHLLNYMSTVGKRNSNEMITCLQETFIEKEGKIPYLWRGNYVLTAGTGHSCGCLTLLSHNLNVLARKEIGNRAHVIVCQKLGDLNATYVVANVYAPNQHCGEKIELFQKVLDQIYELGELYDCMNVLLLGDLNVIFNEAEARNRTFGRNEKRTAKALKDLLDDAELQDCWKGNTQFTWQRANSEIFSCLDRIFYRKTQLELKLIETNWSLSCSDHAAVEAFFDLPKKEESRRDRLIRLDPSLLKNETAKKQIVEGLWDFVRQIPDSWNPHMKLEFIKVGIRTVTEKVQAEIKKKNRTEEEMLNEELKLSIDALIRGDLNSSDKEGVQSHVEDLRIRKGILIDEKGCGGSRSLQDARERGDLGYAEDVQRQRSRP